MKVRLWTGLLVGCCVTALAEEPVPDAKLFALKTELRETVEASKAQAEVQQGSKLESGEASEGAAAGGAPGSMIESKEEFAVTTESDAITSDARLSAFETMNGGPLLTQARRPAELGGAAGWVQTKVWDPVFAPEVVKLGKVKVTGGIMAAIKRKNPFCLLHPLGFAASW